MRRVLLFLDLARAGRPAVGQRAHPRRDVGDGDDSSLSLPARIVAALAGYCVFLNDLLDLRADREVRLSSRLLSWNLKSAMDVMTLRHPVAA
jgi:hypothetical protein